MRKFSRVVIIAPTRSTCLNISIVLTNGVIETLLMQEKRQEVFQAIEKLDCGGFGVVAGTGTGKTVAIRDIAKKILCTEDLLVDVVTREHEATDYTWTCNVLVITPGVALHWFKSGTLSSNDLIVVDEIHQTSEHLELSLALAKRANCTFIWMSATIDAKVYSNYLNANSVIECSAFDPEKKSEAETIISFRSPDLKTFLNTKIQEIIAENRAVACFVPTREMAETLSKDFSHHENLYCDFYHGGEKAEKLRQFLKGEVPKPFLIFMTTAGSSSLNILGLDTVIILDQMYTQVVHSGVPVLEKVYLGSNELLQMGGRVNGRAKNSKIYILSDRNVDFYELKPTVPKFVLGGDLKRVALTCARLGINAHDLELITDFNHNVYGQEVNRFRNRSVIEKDSDELTVYGKRVERLPVDPDWAEILVNAEDSNNQELFELAIATSCVDQLYSLLRRDANVRDILCSGSDHMTAYNIVASAISQFGYIKPNGDGVAYEFRGDWVKSRFDNKTHQQIKEKGEFIAWCDEHDFNAKAIKEVALAIKSVCRQLNVQLPHPNNYTFVKKGDELHTEFVDLLAKVQSLEFVRHEHNSKAGTVWVAQHSSMTSDNILGKIRHWTDKRGCHRASIEGTNIPLDMIEAYVSKIPYSVNDVILEGVQVRFQGVFAEENIGTIIEIVPDNQLSLEFKEQAREKFINNILNRNFSDLKTITGPNAAVRQESENLMILSGGSAKKITLEDERNLYQKEFIDKGIFSIESFIKKEVELSNLLLKLEDFISTEEQEKIRLENPDTTILDGEIFTIQYKTGWYSDTFVVKTEVSESFARSTSAGQIILPSGRVVELCCNGHSAKTFKELVEKLENNRIYKSWEEKRSELEYSSWISDPEKVFPYLSKLLSSVEIIMENIAVHHFRHHLI